MLSYNPYYEKWLAHHGIKNQKWGVKHGPPYPLNRKVSNRIKNPHKYKYKIGTMWWDSGSRLKYQYDNANTSGFAESALADIKDRQWRQTQFRYTNPNGGEKGHISIGGLIDKYGETKVSKVFKDFKKDPEELLKSNVNPGYGQDGTTNNCAKCTAALALSAMGYNVEAGKSSYGRMSGQTDKWFTGAKTNTSSYDDGAKFLESQDNGSFGEISIKRSSGSGHSMFWKKDSDGSVYIKDGQTNEVHKKSSIKELLGFVKDYQCADVDSVDITPLSNTKVNWTAMDMDSVVSKRSIGSNFANKNLTQGDSNKWIDTLQYKWGFIPSATNSYGKKQDRYAGYENNPKWGRVVDNF